MAPTMFEDVKEYLNWYDTRKDIKFKKDAPVIGVVLQRSHLVTGDAGHYDGMVMDLEARGAKVVPVFAGGLTSPSRSIVSFLIPSPKAHWSTPCCP